MSFIRGLTVYIIFVLKYPVRLQHLEKDTSNIIVVPTVSTRKQNNGGVKLSQIFFLFTVQTCYNCSTKDH